MNMTHTILYRIVVSIVFGIIGFGVNFLNLQLVDSPDFKISILAGLLFPLIITLVWGWRYGLLSALAGGCQSMWWLWRNDGWGFLYAVPVFTLWILWHGWWANRRREDAPWYQSCFVVEVPFRIIIELGFYTIFPWLVRFNPPPWNPSITWNHVSLSWIHTVVIKHAITAYVLLVIAYVIINLGPIRRFFGLRMRSEQRDINVIYASAVLMGIALWIIDSTIVFLLYNPSGRAFWEITVADSGSHEILTRTLYILVSLAGAVLLARFVYQRGLLREHLGNVNSVLQTLRNINQLITEEKKREVLIQRTCEILVETRGLDGAWIILVSDSEKLVQTATAGLGEPFEKLRGDYLEKKIMPGCVRESLDRSGKVVIKNPSVDCDDCRLQDLYKGQASLLLLVRLEFEEKVYGVLSILIRGNIPPDEEEIGLMKELGDDIAFALSTIEREKEVDEARKDLRESEQWYRMIYNNAPLGIMHFDSDGIIRDFNDNFKQIMGAARGKILGFNMLEKLLDQAMIKAVKDTLDGQNGHYEGEYLSVTGQKNTFLRAIFQRITDSDGKFIGAVGIFEDITERKQAEQLLKEREALLNKVGTIAKVGGWEMDMLTGRATWSKGTYDIVEIDYDKPVPGQHEHVEYYLPEYREMVENKMKALVETKQPMKFEAALKTAKGNIKWCQAFGEAVVRDGKLIKLRGTFQDITDRKQAEDEIRKLNANLEQRVAARTAELAEKARQMETFTYSVSHDLKAPLRGIDGYSRLLLEDYSDRLDEEGRTFLTTIRYATEQMRQLIEDLLAYSRMERRSLASHEVHPLDLMQTLLAERAEEIDARNVGVTVDMPDVVVKADPEGLAQVLRNLLDNALKFTGKSPDPHIEIGGEEKEKHCIFWVRDNGVGFDMRYHDRIFEIFQRLNPVEDYPGTGIGTAIVQKAMQRMGGRVWAESAPSKGATFYLEVPK